MAARWEGYKEARREVGRNSDLEAVLLDAFNQVNYSLQIVEFCEKLAVYL